MALSQRQRWMVLGGGLAVTVALAAWLSGSPDEPVEPTRDPAREASGQAGGPDKPAGPAQIGRAGSELRLERGDAAGGGEVKDIFAPQSWRPPPPPPMAEAPKRPEMPAFPFTYFGKLIADGRVTVYLAAPDRNLAVKKGDVIDGVWRVEAIGPNRMVFKYLPMGRKQSLEIGRAK